jgi:hypothetical protein
MNDNKENENEILEKSRIKREKSFIIDNLITELIMKGNTTKSN